MVYLPDGAQVTPSHSQPLSCLPTVPHHTPCTHASPLNAPVAASSAAYCCTVTASPNVASLLPPPARPSKGAMVETYDVYGVAPY